MKKSSGVSAKNSPKEKPVRGTLDDAIAIAADAHRGQKDKAGGVYILHPLRIMLSMDSEETRIVAVLHDVVEDSNWTLVQLRERGFSEKVVHAVDCLTKRKGESYKHFVERASRDRIARKVKIGDLEDNMNIRRMQKLGAKELAKLRKYHRAWRKLTADSPNGGGKHD